MNSKRYRKNVACIILSSKYPSECRFFIAQRYDIKDAWQFPQGGIDEGEKPKDALFRELKEEIGTNDIEILCKYPQWVYYDFPQKILDKMYPYIGQRQLYYLVRLKNEGLININTKHPEFIEYKFVNYDSVLKNVSYFKKSVYKRVLSYFKDRGYI